MTSESVVFVGAGDHGRGVLEILHRMNRSGAELACVGFVDDSLTGGAVHGVPLLGNTDWLLSNLSELGASVVLSIASPNAKRKLASLLDSFGARYTSLVHPTAEVSPSCTVGEGSVINAGVVIAYEAKIGAHVTINLNATVGHHVVIGDCSTIAPGANLLGRVQVGEECQIHSNAVILPSLRIGAGAVVGAGSVVLEHVPEGATVFGNPARPVPVSR